MQRKKFDSRDRQEYLFRLSNNIMPRNLVETNTLERDTILGIIKNSTDKKYRVISKRLFNALRDADNNWLFVGDGGLTVRDYIRIKGHGTIFDTSTKSIIAIKVYYNKESEEIALGLRLTKYADHILYEDNKEDIKNNYPLNRYIILSLSKYIKLYSNNIIKYQEYLEL